MPALAGATVEILGEADVAAFDLRLRAGRITFVSTAFTILRELVVRTPQVGRRLSLRFLRPASGALGASEIGRLESTFGVPVVAGLATTETGVITQQGLPPAPCTFAAPRCSPATSTTRRSTRSSSPTAGTARATSRVSATTASFGWSGGRAR